MDEPCQLYDEQGRVLSGQVASKDDIFTKGLLHGAAHVWIWRKSADGIEILLQKRAGSKHTWPNYYDISAAGHINLGEEPMTAALRETKEEIGLDIDETNLRLISLQRAYMIAANKAIENEFQWLYMLQLDIDQNFNIREAEVACLIWKPIGTFKSELNEATNQYVPHGSLYYQTVTTAIESASHT